MFEKRKNHCHLCKLESIHPGQAIPLGSQEGQGSAEKGQGDHTPRKRQKEEKKQLFVYLITSQLQFPLINGRKKQQQKNYQIY